MPTTLTHAANLGYTGVEVWAEQVWLHGDREAEIRHRAEELGLHLTVHAASWDLNLTARNRGIRQASLDQAVRSIELAAAVGATMVTIHPGRLTLHGEDQEYHWELQVDAFRRLAEEGAGCGVLINAELMEPIKREFCTEATDMNRLLAAVNHDHLGVTFDVAHIPLEIRPQDVLLALSRVDEVHLSDSLPSKLHVPLGKGQIAFGPVLAEIARRGLPVTIEGYEVRPTLELAEWNKRLFDRLWAEADCGNAPSNLGS